MKAFWMEVVFLQIFFTVKISALPCGLVCSNSSHTIDLPDDYVSSAVLGPPPDIKKLGKVLKNLDSSYMMQWKNGETVDLKVGFYMESLSAIKPTEMSFDIDLYLRQSWYDERLRHNESRHFTLTDPKLLNHLWYPDLYFANAKTSSFQTVTKPNSLFLVYPDGHVHHSVRVIANIACNLDLHNYPMDVQHCQIRILSYSHPESELRIRWFEREPISHNKNIELPEMIIEEVTSSYCDGRYTFGQTATTQLNDTFSCLLATIKLQRQIGYHMVQTFIPTLLIVSISWISFWIDPSAIPARISLSITTLLTLTTMAAGLRMSLPPVAYAKAIDYWVGTCIFFVFGALLEFALVNSLSRRAEKAKAQVTRIRRKSTLGKPLLNGQEKDGEGPHAPMAQEEEFWEEDGNEKERVLKKSAKIIDSISRVFFPGGFVIFNIVYWLMFTP